ncbi:MAG: class I SAM-dependent methyltransferase [Opitutales bacterium]
MQRRVDPEILDSLAPDDPRALRLHSGIDYFNVLLGNYRWFARGLASVLRPGDRVLEIGAGRGRLLESLQPRFPNEIHWAGLDLACTAPGGFAGEWFQASALDFDGYGAFDVILANHLLHQFTEAELAAIGPKLAGARVLLASEPWRRPHAVGLARLSPLIGMPRLAVHDGVVSVRAGFVRSEMPGFLGLEQRHWHCCETVQLLGAVRLVAERREPTASI